MGVVSLPSIEKWSKLQALSWTTKSGVAASSALVSDSGVRQGASMKSPKLRGQYLSKTAAHVSVPAEPVFASFVEMIRATHSRVVNAVSSICLVL